MSQDSEYVVRRFVEGARWFWTNDLPGDVKAEKVDGGIVWKKTSPERWSADINKAIRFGKKEDAETIVRMYQQGPDPVVCEVGRVRWLEIE